MMLHTHHYKVIIEDAQTGEVVVQTRTTSAAMVWLDPATDTVKTWGDLAPGFAARLVMEQLGGPRGAMERLGAFLTKKAAKRHEPRG